MKRKRSKNSNPDSDSDHDDTKPAPAPPAASSPPPASPPPLTKKERKRLGKLGLLPLSSTQGMDLASPTLNPIFSLHIDLSIRIERIPELVLYSLGSDYVTKPTFVDMSRRGAIQRIVLIMAGGIDLETYRRQPSWLSGIRARCGPPVPITLPKYDTSPGYQTNLLLRIPAKQKVVAETKKKPRNLFPHPPDHYLLTLEDMESNSFPLPIILDDSDQVACPDGFLATQPPSPTKSYPKMVSMDCEMVTTEAGLELARVTLLDGTSRETLLDMYVSPSSVILDYNTRYSGITPESLSGVETKLHDAQQAILRLVSSETILIGHSLENDLHALHLIHPRILDTSLLFPHTKGPPWKNSLRNLTEKFLKRSIQKTVHDSREDALAALDLTLLKIKHGPNYGTPEGREHPKEHVADLLSQVGKRSVLLDRPDVLKRMVTGNAHAVVCHDDAEVVTKLASSLLDSNFVYASLHQLEQYHDVKWLRTEYSLVTLADMVHDAKHDPDVDVEVESRIKTMDASISTILDKLPKSTVALICTSQGDTARAKKAHELRLKRMDPGVRDELGLPPWSPDDEEKFTVLTQRVSSVMLFSYCCNDT